MSYDENSNQLPQLADDMLASSSATVRKQIADDYIASDAYVFGFGKSAPWLAGLREIEKIVRNATPQSGLQALRQRILKIVREASIVPDRDDTPSPVKTRLWNSLCAAFVSPRSKPHDRSELMDAIRSYAVIEKLRSTKSVHELQATIRAKPLIPKDLLRSSAAQTTTRDTDEATKDLLQTTLDRVNEIRGQILGLEAAIEDIDLSQSRSLGPTVPTAAAPLPTPRSAPVSERPQTEIPGQQTPGQQVPGQQVPAPLFAQAVTPLWTLPNTTVDLLKPVTKAMVAAADRSLALDSRVDIVMGLEKEAATAYNQLFQLGGAGAMVGISNSVHQLDIDDILAPNDHHNFPTYDATPFNNSIEGSVGSVQPIGIGDLLIATESILRYEEGEVAHIENILKSEHKERVHRRLDREEVTTFTATERTEESEKDLQSTERHELQTETAKTIDNEMSLDTGINVSASYGPMVSVEASADFSTGNSVESSMRSATNFAQEVTERSVSKITQSAKEEITTTLISEIEETNSHGFDNVAGTDHVVGIYRWVDKYYQAQVYNYGKRLMLEFIVPEPAAFHLHARKMQSSPDVVLEEPEPLDEGFSFKDLTLGNYQLWVDRYKVADVSPPPPRYKTICKSLDQMITTTNGIYQHTRSDMHVVPEGYQAVEAHVTSYSTSVEHSVFIATVGRSQFWIYSGDQVKAMNYEDGEVAISVHGFGVTTYAMTIEILCQRTYETFQAWQIETFNAIVAAYNNLKSAYDAQVAAAQISQGVAISGNNPGVNRQIERDELKKSCLVLLTDQHFVDFDATEGDVDPNGYPEIKVDEAMSEGRFTQFFEQFAEWENLTYVFYPYFWGRKEVWAENSQRQDTDPLFQAFLQAGAARVLVPVRPTYEEALLYYLESGEIWNGGEMPTIDNEFYVSIVDELKEATDVSLEEAEPYGEPWEIKLPTSLVKLQDDSTLPNWQTPATTT